MISIDGLVTGFDTTGIIEDLLEIQRRPLSFVKAQAENEQAKQTAYSQIVAKLLALQTAASKLGSSDLFSQAQVTSSDESVLTARAGTGVAAGSYTFRVAKLARSSQFVSAGFATEDETAIGAGTLTIEIGRGHIDRATSLDDLNGGSGVDRGKIVISDRAGKSATVDLSAAVTVQDVLDAINSASGISVTARIATTGDTKPGEAIVITDTSGGSGTLSVAEVGSGRTARDLGIRSSAAGSALQGTDIASIAESTRLSLLNDGNGVAFQAGNDLAISQKNGSSFSVDLSEAATVGDVIAAINGAAGNEGVTATIAADGNRLVLSDTTSPSGTTTISEVRSGRAACDLGILGSFDAESEEGDRLIAGLGTVLLRELRGGSGIAAGSILVTDRSGGSATIDLSSAETVSDVIDAINAAAGISIAASVNRSGDGLMLEDTSGGSGLLYVEEVGGGSTAEDLGILNASGVASDELDGEDVKIRYISPTTRLETLNAGRGVYAGSIRITDRSGRSFTVNLAQEETIDDVMTDINGAAAAAGSDVTAAINGDGNGLLLTSTAGSGTLRVDEVGAGTTAADLGIEGSAPSSDPGSLNGSFERSIAISASMTLEELRDAVEDLDLPVSLAIVNDGSSHAPYRLLISGTESGEFGRVIVHGRGTDATFRKAAEAQDAVVMVGGSAGTSPLVVRSSTNVFDEIIPDLAITVLSESGGAVEVTARPDDEGIYEAIEGFVTRYNGIVESIRELTRYDAEAEEAGLLLGDSALRNALSQLSANVTRYVSGSPSDLNLAAHIGLRVSSGGQLIFDASKLEARLASNRAQVKALFAAERQLDLATELEDFRNGEGVRSAAGQVDFEIHTRDGSSFSVDLGSATTVRGVLDAINDAAGNSTVTAAIAGDGRSLILTDSSTGSSTFRVTSLNGSSAYNDLGINRSADQPGGGTITGSPIDLTGDWGLGRRLAEAIERMVNIDTGSVQLRAEGVAKRIEDLKERAADMEERIARQEDLLRRQFAQLEVIMGEQQNTLQRLTAIMGTLRTRSSR